MIEDHPLGHSGRTRGVNDEGQVAGLDRHIRPTLVAASVGVEPRHAGPGGGPPGTCRHRPDSLPGAGNGRWDRPATAGTGARIAATRKTTPGLRALEKEAVQHGGGLPHRFGLFDAALVKDNHIRAAGSLTAAVAAVRERLGHVHLIEVETESLAQVQEALDCRAAVIMLDNMDLGQVRAAVRLVAGRAVVEVSGGVTLDRVGDLAGAGVDIISVGALTTAAPWVDIGLDME